MPDNGARTAQFAGLRTTTIRPTKGYCPTAPSNANISRHPNVCIGSRMAATMTKPTSSRTMTAIAARNTARAMQATSRKPITRMCVFSKNEKAPRPEARTLRGAD